MAPWVRCSLLCRGQSSNSREVSDCGHRCDSSLLLLQHWARRHPCHLYCSLFNRLPGCTCCKGLQQGKTIGLVYFKINKLRTPWLNSQQLSCSPGDKPICSSCGSLFMDRALSQNPIKYSILNYLLFYLYSTAYQCSGPEQWRLPTLPNIIHRLPLQAQGLSQDQGSVLHHFRHTSGILKTAQWMLCQNLPYAFSKKYK